MDNGDTDWRARGRGQCVFEHTHEKRREFENCNDNKWMNVASNFRIHIYLSAIISENIKCNARGNEQPTSILWLIDNALHIYDRVPETLFFFEKQTNQQTSTHDIWMSKIFTELYWNADAPKYK